MLAAARDATLALAVPLPRYNPVSLLALCALAACPSVAAASPTSGARPLALEPVAAQRATGPRVTSQRTEAQVMTQLRAGIRTVSPDEIEFTRDAFNLLLLEQARLLRAARMMPALQNGQPVGIRILGVTPDGVLALLGLQNGDIVVALNNLPIASPEQALGAYSAIRNATTIEARIERAGTVRVVRYRLRTP